MKTKPVSGLILIAVVVAMYGCANSRVLYKPPLGDPSVYSQIVVYRNYMVMGSGPMTLTVDGVPVAEFSGGEYLSVDINPGHHVVTTINVNNVSVASITEFEEGKRYYFDATYERRTTTGILRAVNETTANTITKGMERVY